jgi:tetratricopeptide (TPR) repeat protein
MPSLQDIEKFKDQLNALGGEPDILAEQGEAIEEPPPPEQVLPSDLGELFIAGGSAPAEAAAIPSGELEAEAGTEAPPGEALPVEAAPGEEALDFSSLFGLEAPEEPEAQEAPPAFPTEPEAETAEALAETPAEPSAEAFEAMMGAPAEPSTEAPGEQPVEFTLPPELEAGFGEELTPPAEAFGEEALQPPEELQVPSAGEAAPLEEPFPPPAEMPAEEPVKSLEEEFGLPAEGFFGAPEAGAVPGEAAEEAPAVEEMPQFEAAELAPAPSAPIPGGAIPGAAIPGAPVPSGAAPRAEALSTEAPSFPAPKAEAGEEALAGLPEELAGPAVFEEPLAEAPATPAGPPAGGEEAPLAAGAPGPEAAPGGPSPEEFSLSERRFAQLKRTLGELPRNLKIVIEELIGVRGLAGPGLASLTGLLARGAAPAQIAAEVSRITGQRVRLPRGYERLTGLAFEEERARFGYAFRENILPILRVALLSLLFLGLLSFLGYRYIYRPLYANVLYRQGYLQIPKDRYPLAEELFARANSIIRYKGWYLRYAGAYTDRRQYPLAAQKYELLLRHFPLDKQGTLAYAGLLTYSTFGWERAEQILDGYLENKDFKDRDVLLARGDNFLEWAQEDGKLYEQARLQYATILDHYGEDDPVLFRMLRFFIRDKPPHLKETRDLYRLLESKKDLDVPAKLFASVYAELGGFWLDQAEAGNQKAYEDVKDVLFKAMRRDKLSPEVHYQLARYYRYLQDDREEEKALKNAISLLENAMPQPKQLQVALIDSYTRLGESYWRRKEYLEAEQNFAAAITLIEQKQDQRIIGLAPQFGTVYKDRGDIYYYVSRDLRAARAQYDDAEKNGYRNPELDFKIGYLDYADGLYDQALLRFARVVDERGGSENALYSLANALYYQGFFSSAQGYYLRLLDLLEIRKDRIPFLQPATNPEHRDLIEFMMKVYNNLGVTYRRLGERSRNPDLEAKALVNLTFSSEYFDQLSRDPNTAERGITRNLAFLNQRGILYPGLPYELQLYDRIPLDLEATVF